MSQRGGARSFAALLVSSPLLAGVVVEMSVWNRTNARGQWTNVDLLLIDPIGFKIKRSNFHTAKLDLKMYLQNDSHIVLASFG